MRFREDNPGDLGRARAAVATWRDQNPAGTPEQLVAALGAGFHRDYGPVLRALLFAADHHPLIVPRVRRYLTDELGVSDDPILAADDRLIVLSANAV